MTGMTFPSPLVASIAYQNVRKEKSRRLRHFPTTWSTIGTQKMVKFIKFVSSDATVITEKWLGWPSQAPWWQVLHTKMFVRNNREGLDPYQPPRVPLGRTKSQKSPKIFATKPPSWPINNSNDLPKSSGGVSWVMKRSTQRTEIFQDLVDHRQRGFGSPLNPTISSFKSFTHTIPLSHFLPQNQVVLRS